MSARIDNFSDEEFAEIVASNFTLLDVAKALGYLSHSGDNGGRIRKRIRALNLSTEHFAIGHKSPVKRTPENIFIEHSTAAQKP